MSANLGLTGWLKLGEEHRPVIRDIYVCIAETLNIKVAEGYNRYTKVRAEKPCEV